MNKNNAVCFTGHRKLKNSFAVREAAEKEIIRLVKGGAQEFYIGMAEGFDLLVGEIIVNLKWKYPHIKLYSVLPCHPEYQTENMSTEDLILYMYVLSRADGEVLLSNKYYSGCFHARNRFIVEKSDLCVCYLTKKSGGTAYTVKKAQEKGIKVINIADKINAL
jgi:uncharacterized phage-like protein YoqJ